MLWRLWRLSAALLVLILVFCTLGRAQAARGVPGSADFGIGAVIYSDGPHLAQSLEMAGELDLDWISVPFEWAANQPNPAQTPRFDNLDMVMGFAADRQLAVLISLTDAPEWVLTPTGPNPDLTAAFVSVLAQRYPGTLQAIELFPGANTRAGWRAQPDAPAYASLLRLVSGRLLETAPSVMLVAAGLRPFTDTFEKGDISDLEFLNSLYANGAATFMPVVSLQLDNLTDVPMAFPDGRDFPVLRHYEEVRRVMSGNGHQNGLIWITRLCPPSSKISVSNTVPEDINTQSNWMSLAYIQLRSQLYIGVTIGQSLNPEPGGDNAGFPSMIGGTGDYHPFYSVLRDMISLNKTGSVSIMPGKPKEGQLGKLRP